jgi:EmrB/QacA subfamily drug resistance transporter
VDVQWVIEAYALLLAALLLVGGSLGDMYGRKRMFATGVVVFAAASAWCGLVTSVKQLIFARAVQGAGAALLVPGSLAIISASFGKHERGRAIGTWSGFTSMTAAVGPVLGGWLIERGSWRSVFFINLPIAFIVLVLTFWRVPESSNRQVEGNPDWLGAALATIGLGGIVYALIESTNRGWSNGYIRGTLLVGLSALALFLLVEARSRSPLVPLELFRSRNFSGANLLTLFLYGALSAMFFFLPLNLVQVQGYTAAKAGAATVPFILLMFALSRWSGGLVDRYGAKLPLVYGPIGAAAGFTLLAVQSTGGSYWTTFFPGIVVLGLGMVTSVAPLTTTVMSSVAESQAGIASGINNAVSRLAAVLSIAVLGIVMLRNFDDRLTSDLARLNLGPAIQKQIEEQRMKLAAIEIPQEIGSQAGERIRQAIRESFVAGFRLVMLIASGLALASAAIAWLIVGDPPPRRSRDAADIIRVL